MSESLPFILVGAGPAALMAADVLSSSGQRVQVFEKRKSAGRKLLVAGSSGLNITNSLEFERFVSHYSGASPEFWRRVIGAFTPKQWMAFIEQLGIATFEGTSRRCFIEDMKAPRFLQAWLKRLRDQGVEFVFDAEATDFECGDVNPRLELASGEWRDARAIGFALGGGSWEPHETPLRWPSLFIRKGIGFEPFNSSNCGYQVAWTPEFLKEAEGKPLKRIVMQSEKATREGDAMITAYGIEGTPIYFAGMSGEVTIDLRPDLSREQILERLRSVKENLSPIRRVKKVLGLCEASLALLFHHTPKEILSDPKLVALVDRIKSFPLSLGEAQPLSEAISSSGGVRMDEINEWFMLKRAPGVFMSGEMLDWDVPTGGFLLQACVAQGKIMAEGMLSYAKENR